MVFFAVDRKVCSCDTKYPYEVSVDTLYTHLFHSLKGGKCKNDKIKFIKLLPAALPHNSKAIHIMKLKRSLILNTYFGTRMALFISLVMFVLRCKHCSYSNESGTKIISPVVKGNKGTVMSILQSYKHTFKCVMSTPSQEPGKGETPHSGM